MDHIPISFECNGKKYSGHFTEVSAAGTVWHLSSHDNYYMGRLRKVNDSWVFDATPKTEDLSTMAEFFGEYLIQWYE